MKKFNKSVCSQYHLHIRRYEPILYYIQNGKIKIVLYLEETRGNLENKISLCLNENLI